MSAAPVLETERLRLRPHGMGDFAGAYAMWSNPEVTRFIGGKPSTAPQVHARILVYAGHWRLCGYGYWAVEEKATGTYLGDCGYMDLRRDIDAAMRDAPEAGWVLDPRGHGNGYATEAMRAATVWRDARIAERRSVCIIGEGNDASVNVARKLGFTRVGSAIYLGEPTGLYERVR